ncbi:MAG: transcriptional regulator [Pseudonocardiales bacterium]|nr:MAG: transcriptional regulator [Pseudonocardiales bacterium]
MGHREQLLAAARRLLEQRGYAHITARDLVAESDTNLASIGYHFGSKAALLNAAIESAFEDWTDQLAALVMADPTATPIQRGAATWVAVLDSLPARQPILQSYVEALAQAQREPDLRGQLAEHYRRARARVAHLVAESLADGTPAEDPRCRAIATFVLAVCDGLAVQWLLDPEHSPNGEELMAGLATVWAASFPVR